MDQPLPTESWIVTVADLSPSAPGKKSVFSVQAELGAMVIVSVPSEVQLDDGVIA